MPKILFASNSISHFPGSVVSNLAWTYDPLKVPYSINAPQLTVVGSPEFAPTTGDETWFHFRMGATGWPNNYADRFFEVTDIDGNRMVLVSYDSSSNEGYLSFVDTGAQQFSQWNFLPWGGSQIRTFDIKVKFTDITYEYELYVNEILVTTITASVAQRRYPRYIRLGGNGSASTGSFFSEIIVADGDTRNSRLDLLRPVAAGVHEDWNGPLAYLADDDPTTGMTTLAALQKQSTQLTPYGGAQNISNVVQVTTTVRGINSPDLLRHLIRLSAVDYETGDFSIPFEKDFQVTDWNVNPATSQPWTAQDLATAEFGFVSDETP